MCFGGSIIVAWIMFTDNVSSFLRKNYGLIQIAGPETRVPHLVRLRVLKNWLRLGKDCGLGQI